MENLKRILGADFDAKELLNILFKFAKEINKDINIMNVCGSHEHTITVSGLRNIMPENINLIPGPGCPVCVCAQKDIKKAIYLSLKENVILATYGDMLRVPVKLNEEEKEIFKVDSSVISLRQIGGNYKIVSSPLEVLKLALNNPDKKIVFFSVGFETTTAPLVGFLNMDLPKNLYFLIAHKITPAIVDYLLTNIPAKVDAFLLPGHVSAIIGEVAWEFLPKKYKMPGVIAGFTVENLLLGFIEILRQILENDIKIENVYKTAVKKEGNKYTLKLFEKYLKVSSAYWRSIGEVPNSAHFLKDEFSYLDAEEVFEIPNFKEEKIEGCICGEIVLGLKLPKDCPLFKKVCTPLNPVGPCMVSHEGACNIWYRFSKFS